MMRTGFHGSWRNSFPALFCLVLFGVSPLVKAQEPASLEARTVMAGDRLRIEVAQAPELSKDYAVAGDGSIDVNILGRLPVEGLTTEGVADLLVDRLNRSYFKEATVTVEVSEFVEGSVLLFGEVRNPMKLDVSGDQLITLMEVLADSGGLTERAAGDRVHILRWKPGGRMERETILVDVKEMLENADFRHDQYLRPRDIIFVPAKQGGVGSEEFLALGEFSTPGFHDYVEGMDVIRAVVAAGGVSREGRMDAARLLRPTAGGEYEMIPLDLARLFGSADMQMNIPILAGDILFVPSMQAIIGGKVYFLGQVERPGAIALPPTGEATLARTLLTQVGFSKFANRGNVKVIRKAPDGKRQELVVDVGAILDAGDFSNDIPLSDDDVVMVSESIFSF
ncbi:MAG TPA: polysaccharide biosynthesis/export family protein [Saprospiraceae bacterium]|nr:polysaccharide biosynthesis/export family protein [Saprospiraceae bacterium]